MSRWKDYWKHQFGTLGLTPASISSSILESAISFLTETMSNRPDTDQREFNSPSTDSEQITEWVILQDRFQKCDSTGGSYAERPELEAEAASRLFQRLTSGGLGASDPVVFFQFALDRLKDKRPTTDLCKHLRSTIKPASMDHTGYFDKHKWMNLQPTTKSQIWQVVVRGYLLDVAKRYNFTDLQDAGDEGELPARVSAIACGLLMRLETDCLLGKLDQPLSVGGMTSIYAEDTGKYLEIDPDSGTLRCGENSIQTTNITALRVLEALHKDFNGFLNAKALIERVWAENPDIKPDAIRKQIAVTENLLKKVTEDYTIDRRRSLGWRLMRIQSES